MYDKIDYDEYERRQKDSKPAGKCKKCKEDISEWDEFYTDGEDFLCGCCVDNFKYGELLKFLLKHYDDEFSWDKEEILNAYSYSRKGVA